MKPESWEQRARRLDPFHPRGLRWLVVGALALLAAGVVLIIWDGSGLTHRWIRIVDAWDLRGDCPKPKTQGRTPVQFVWRTTPVWCLVSCLWEPGLDSCPSHQATRCGHLLFHDRIATRSG